MNCPICKASVECKQSYIKNGNWAQEPVPEECTSACFDWDEESVTICWHLE